MTWRGPQACTYCEIWWVITSPFHPNPVSLNMYPQTVYNHMDAVVMCCWDPDPPNILESDKGGFFCFKLHNYYIITISKLDAVWLWQSWFLGESSLKSRPGGLTVTMISFSYTILDEFCWWQDWQSGSFHQILIAELFLSKNISIVLLRNECECVLSVSLFEVWTMHLLCCCNPFVIFCK